MSHRSLTLCSFWQGAGGGVCFLSLSGLGTFYRSVLLFTDDPLSSLPQFFVYPASFFFFLLLYFSVLQFPFLVLFYNSLYCDFLSCICFQWIWNYLWKHFYNGCFNILVREFQHLRLYPLLSSLIQLERPSSWYGECFSFAS